MTDRHYVLIHGLASKPPPEVLVRRYRGYLGESIGEEIPESGFHLAYPSDLMGYVVWSKNSCGSLRYYYEEAA